ncbi:hypothetical protein BDQ17DRAFT_1404601 [Cyathus striatus]|nr:hypothetical protein BDQ17DRAFT_1404601 [Cyathus striatus]
MPSAYLDHSSAPKDHSDSQECGTPAETNDPRTAYKAVQNGKVAGNATNIAGTDLSAIAALLGTNLTPDQLGNVHRFMMMTNMQTSKSFEAVQNTEEVNGDAYNAAGIGHNPNAGASSRKN